VSSQQGGYQFTGAVPLYVLGSIVTSSIVLELGPLMTAFVIIGRVGARITAELGTMKVSEQIDALCALGRSPVRALAAPRIAAGVLVMPILVGVADVTGVYAGMLAARWTLGLGTEAFLYGARLFWHDWDFFYSLTKAVAFGFVIPLVSVHAGLGAHGGAEGVGRATTASVVLMIVSVLCLDTLFPPLLLG
jgi:phospholipid/cholesterol/gamma-HCH transport system permease protein